MINNLRGRVILLMLAGIISSILVVGIITNVTLFNKFDSYMKSEQKNKVNNLIELVQKTYQASGGWTEETFSYVHASSLAKDFDILIKDIDGTIVFSSEISNTVLQHHISMMNRMGHRMIGMPRMGYGSRGDYTVEEYDIAIDNKVVGYIEIGFLGPFTITEREIQFSKSINSSIIYASILSVIIAIFLGVYFSKVITRPIIKINRAANDIREGKLDARIDEKSKIIELKGLSSSINHLALSLEEQQRKRKRLTTDISHELRTPLTILQSHVEAMLDGVWEPTRDKLSIFKSEIDRLIKLVEELKYLVDIENHRLVIQKEEFNLSHLLLDIIKSFKYQANKQNITFEHGISNNIIIHGDKDKINQAIINIVSNALKFTGSGGNIKVSAKSMSNSVIIEVEDNGVGIDKDDLPYIFDRLYRGDKSRSRKTGGTGIGLTITQKLIHAHGGEIEVRSTKGKGTKFIVTIPIS